MIFRNYVNFEHLLDLYGKAISSKIIAAKNGRHRNTAEELGVRIQTSFIGDMTCETAVSNVSIEADIRAGNYHRGLLEDMDEEDSLMFSRELVTLQVMRDEFELVSTEVERLKPSEKKVFIPYIMKEKTIQEIADDRNIEYDYTHSVLICLSLLGYYIHGNLGKIEIGSYANSCSDSGILKYIPYHGHSHDMSRGFTCHFCSIFIEMKIRSAELAIVL
nr:hypothetical protein [Lachnospiraceae bacterium C1.1]